jgi:hypothetical protein
VQRRWPVAASEGGQGPVLPDTPRFSGGKHDINPLVNSIGTLN